MKPTSEQETGMAIIAVVIILLFLFLSSCSTKKTITEYVTVHDTLVVHHSDTLKIIKETKDTIIDRKFITLHDTLHYEKERVIVLDEKGDTISERERERLWQKIHELEAARHDESHSDSSAYYKSSRDSLQRILDSQKEKKTVKTKLIPLWQNGLFFAVILVVCVIILKSRTR